MVIRNAASETSPAAPGDSAAVAAFEASIRQLGEGPARLENLADLVVGLLEARRDHKLATRTGSSSEAA